jgi:uracil-DNA glycosylase
MKLLIARGEVLPRPRPQFAHGATWEHDGLTLVGAFHPSRQNTNTGKLTPPMYDEVFRTVRQSLRK